MTCTTLHQLVQLCQDQHIAFSVAEMVRVACSSCASTEVCPAIGSDEYEARRGLENEIPISHNLTEKVNRT